MIGYKELEHDFSLESISRRDGKVYITGKALSKDFECEAGLKALSEDAVGKSFTWRHRHPIQHEHRHNHIYGKIEKGWVDDFLMLEAEVYTHTKDHKDLINVIDKRNEIDEPLGFSMHYRTYRHEDGKKYHWDVFEVAGTPYPACETCKITDIGVMKMGNEEKADKEKADKEKKKLKELKDAAKTIKELEDNLNSKTKTLEEFKTKIEKLESSIAAKNEEAKITTKTLEEQMSDMKLEIEYLKNKKPIIDKILEFEPNFEDVELEWLKTQGQAFLKRKLEKVEKASVSQIHVKELEESAKNAKTDKAKEDLKLEDTTYETFTQNI